MELDQICLFIHAMACLAKKRTHWAAVGDAWAHTPRFVFLAARMRFVTAWTEGRAEHSAGLRE